MALRSRNNQASKDAWREAGKPSSTPALPETGLTCVGFPYLKVHRPWQETEIELRPTACLKQSMLAECLCFPNVLVEPGPVGSWTVGLSGQLKD